MANRQPRRTGKSNHFAALGDDAERLRIPQPEWISPMLAVLTDRRFSSPDFLFERKLDGERALAFRTAAGTRLMSRNRKDISRFYPEIVDAMSRQPCKDFIADGEIVAFEGSRTSFELLQSRMHYLDPDPARRTPVFFYLFDLPYLAGFDLRAMPLKNRKKLLRAAIRFEDPLRYTVHRVGDGEAYFAKACDRGWEGLIAKRADSTYTGNRSPQWLKFKCSRRQELVIGGFTAPQGSRTGFGALLVGYYERGKLRYAGKVGTGFDSRMLMAMYAEMKKLARGTSPFVDAPRERHVTWIEPRMVGEFSFWEWTAQGRLRQSSFIGLRTDKPASKVAREVPA